MDFCDKSKLVKSLREKVIEAKGMLRESILYKIEKLEATLPHNCYAMPQVLTRDALLYQIYIEKRLAKGFNKLQRGEPGNEGVEEIARCSNLRLYHLQQELTRNYAGQYGEFPRTDGLLTLTLEKAEFDPCVEVRHVCFSANRMPAGALDLHGSGRSVEIQLEKTGSIGVELYDADKHVVFGFVLLPAIFFIDNSEKSVILEINTFHFLTFKVKFQRCKLIYRTDQKFQCYVKAQHAFERVENVGVTYCNVCSKRCKLCSEVYACMRCRVLSHLQCAEYMLFKCKAIQENEPTADGSSAAQPPVEEKFNIEHSFEEATSAGVRFCGHCGARIAAGASMRQCRECDMRCHAGCEPYVFSSCGISYELRRQIVVLHSERVRNIKERTTMKISDFKLLSTIGKGSFGKVYKAEESKSGKVYAIKVIKKQSVYTFRDFANLKTEKAVLRLVSNDHSRFVTKMHFGFQDNHHIYIGLDYEPCGDMHRLVSGARLPEERVRSFTAEIIAGLEFLHKNNIAFRDLKLDNILLTPDGHIKLCDFGLSKCEMGPSVITYTYCGSLDTVSPEVLKGKGYTRSTDFWSLGVIVYEMLHQKAPFYGATIKELAHSIAATELEIDADLSEDAKDFIQCMLAKQPHDRLGAADNGLFRIMSHPWFKGLDWDTVRSRGLPMEPVAVLEDDEPCKSSRSPTMTPTLSVVDLLDYVTKYARENDKKH